jgi:4'-phosphopantetheinyl transferase
MISELPTQPAAVRQQRLASPDSDVQIFMANADALSAREIVELNVSLSETERTRATRFYFERDRHRYIAARSWLRHRLGAALGRPASALVFENGPHGKPRLIANEQDGRQLHFNLSHSGSIVVFALAWDRELGIDLEAIGRSPTGAQELDSLAARVLSERELALWRELPNPATRRGAFFRAWTRKEAYLKGTGKGLSAELRSIEIMLPDQSSTICWSEAVDRWMLHDVVVPSGFVAALAVEKP